MSTQAQALWNRAFREVERHSLGLGVGLGHTMSGGVSLDRIDRARKVLQLDAAYRMRSARRARIAQCLGWIGEAEAALRASDVG